MALPGNSERKSKVEIRALRMNYFLLFCLPLLTPALYTSSTIINIFRNNHRLSAISKSTTVSQIKSILQNRDKDLKDPIFDKQVVEWIDYKSLLYSNQGNIAITNPLLYGNYNVSYVTTSSATSVQKNEGNPAGGRYRGKIGQSIFKINEIYQNIIKSTDGINSYAINVVKGKLFSLIPFCVISFGYISILTDKERDDIFLKYKNKLTISAVRVLFTPPLLCFGSIPITDTDPSLHRDRNPIFHLESGRNHP